MSAYPALPATVVDFRYLTDLHLQRTIKAVRRRTGQDALYALGHPYGCEVRLTCPNGGAPYWHPIAVPTYFLTDLASVPRLARPIIGRVGPHLEASIIHDWLYSAWQVESCVPNEDMRRFCDATFLEAMKVAGVSRFKRWLIWRAVRLGGRGPFFGSHGRLFVKE